MTQHVSVSSTAALYVYVAGTEGQRKPFLLIPSKETAVKAEKWNATKGLFLLKADIWQHIMSVKEHDYLFVILSEVGCYRNSLVQLLGMEVICRVFKA